MFPSAVPGLPRLVRSHAGAWSAWCCGWKLARRLSCCLSAWGLTWFGETSHVQMLILWRGIEFYLSNNVHGDFGVSGWISTGWCLEALVQVYTDSISNWVMWARNVMFFSIAFCDVSPQKPALLAKKFAKMLLKITCFHSRWGQDSTLNVCRPQDSLG